jgi:hypothetical protein
MIVVMLVAGFPTAMFSLYKAIMALEQQKPRAARWWCALMVLGMITVVGTIPMMWLPWPWGLMADKPW